MRFRKIRLENFRSHISTELDLATLTVIRGTNAAGKSSIEQAIQITLASRADGTGSDGKGCGSLVRAGASKGLITLTAQIPSADGPAEERILKCAVSDGKLPTVVVGNPGDPQYSGGEEWMHWLGQNREVLSCLINNRHFVDLKPDDQQNVLASIILPKTYDWPEWVKPMAHSLALKINWARTPFEIIDEAYGVAFKERTNINRDVKTFKLPEGDVSAAGNLEEFSRKAATRRQEFEAVQKRKYELESAIRSNAQMLTAAQERLTSASARLSREQQDIPSIEARMLNPQKLKEVEKSAKHSAKAIAADAEIAKLTAELVISKQSLKALNQLADEPKCPTCATPMTEEMFAALAKPVVDAQNRLTADIVKLQDERKAFGNPEESRRAVEDHQRALTDMQRAKERIAEEQTAISDAEAKIAELKASAAEVDSSAIADLDREAADLTARIENCTREVDKARSAKELAGRIEAAESERKALLHRQRDLNRLVDYFGEEVKAELLAASIGSFTDAMNGVLGQWGYTCQLSIEPYIFAIVYLDADSKPHPISLANLSKSERYRFSTAFQVALAVFTGFKFVIADEADIYDAKGKTGLFRALMSGQLDQAIILSTDEREAVPAVPDSIWYRFDDVAQPGMIPTTQVRRLLPAAVQAA